MTRDDPNGRERVLLAETCPTCAAIPGDWCRTRGHVLAKYLHEPRALPAATRARYARGQLDDPEGMRL